MIWVTAKEICKELTAIKSDFVVVGSTALILHGLIDREPKDIDCMALDLKGFSGDLHSYFTDSRFSDSGKRACILENGITIIDIFVENYTPDFIYIDEIRVASRSFMLSYHKRLLNIVTEHWRADISNKIKLLSYYGR